MHKRYYAAITAAAIFALFFVLTVNYSGVQIQNFPDSIAIEDDGGIVIDPATSDDVGGVEDAINNKNTSKEWTQQEIRNLLEDLQERGRESRSLFGEQEVATRTQLIDLVSTLGTSVIRDRKDTQGSGNIPEDAAATGELVVETGPTANSYAVLRTLDQGRYTPGQPAQAGIGFRTLSAPTGGQEWKAGYFDQDSGFFFGQNSTCLYVAEERAGDIIKSQCRSGWNGFNITEELGRTWNMTDGAILQIDYAWYGYGAVIFSIVETRDLTDVSDPRLVQQTVPVHVIVNSGNTSIADPIQPIRVNASNGGTAENYEVRVGGRQYSVIGASSKTRRIVGDGPTQTTVGTSDYECISAFRKSRTGDANNTEIKLQGVSAISNGNTRFALLYNANLTNGTEFTAMENTPATESALRSNTSNCDLAQASGFDVQFAEPNGTKLFGALATGSSTGGGSPGQVVQGDLNVELPALEPIVLVARAIDGSSNEASAEVRFVSKR